VGVGEQGVLHLRVFVHRTTSRIGDEDDGDFLRG
jgi:hypothetical protein